MPVTPDVLAARLVPIILDVSIEHPRSLLASLGKMGVDVASEQSMAAFDPEFLFFAFFPFDWLLGTAIGVEATSTRHRLRDRMGAVLNSRRAVRGLPPSDAAAWRQLAHERSTEYANVLLNCPEENRDWEFGRVVVRRVFGRTDPLAEIAVVNWFYDMLEFYEDSISTQVIVGG